MICRACVALTRLYGAHKTSKCQTCTNGGKYFPHYALAFTTAALQARQEDEDHVDIKLARLTKESVLARRDIDNLICSLHDPTKPKPDKFSRFTMKARAGLSH